MPLPSLLAATLVTAALVLTGTAAAAPAAAEGPIGGERLGEAGIVVAPDAPLPPEIAAASWVVADLDTGEVLAAKDPHGRYAPASTLKILTAVTLLPLLDADLPITPTFADIDVEGSKVGLVEQVSYPARELFAALLMVSGNDAANALATAAGGQQVTAAAMNDRAHELGALDTRAVNPHGLDAEGQLSSAYDLALLGRAGLADADFARYVSTRRASVGAPPDKARIEIVNKNKLLRDYVGALGVKNGYTTRARASFVGAAERDGRRLVVTMMQSDPKIFDEAVRLLDWGFAAADVEPIGSLDPGGTDAVTQLVEGLGLAGSTDRTSSAPAGGLPVALAGMGLAAAAVFVVRDRPAPDRRRREISGAPGRAGSATRGARRPSRPSPARQR
ncbi:MAG: D-alanyl-D-alanine carboxypeptidase [Actinomycetota bacterium]|nr:D-alanyl-D-alanine carboxypeptidase [Actinomycetota bacterium]